MARLTPTARSKISKSAFGVPSKAPGSGSYPMPDAAHARAAVGLAHMHHDPHTAQIERKAHSLFPGSGSD